MAVTRTASLKSSAFFIIDGFYSVNNVICRKFSKDLINIKEKDKKVSLPHHSPKKKTRNTTNTKGIRASIAPREDAKPRRFFIVKSPVRGDQGIGRGGAKRNPCEQALQDNNPARGDRLCCKDLLPPRWGLNGCVLLQGLHSASPRYTPAYDLVAPNGALHRSLII